PTAPSASRWLTWRATGSPGSSKSARARYSAGWSNASRTARSAFRSAGLTILRRRKTRSLPHRRPERGDGDMMFDLTGRTALVTGATGGIGGAIAQALHAQGATVAISGTRREALDTLAARLGAKVHVLPCNLSDTAEVEALVPAAEKAMGQLDILVANAGITRDNLFVKLRDEDWDEVIKV